MGQYFTNEQLPSKINEVKCNILGTDFVFFTDNGVFSKKGIDFGSRLLLEFIPLVEVGAEVLDMGCGYGVFGIVLNKVTSCEVDMVDVNLRAMHLALINSKENHCINGYGVLGIVISKKTGANVDMVDINKRALHLAKQNLKANKCANITIFESNAYQNVKKKYDTIITNPPIRAGKKIVYEMVMGASDHLNEKGNLFLVIKKEQGAKSLIIDLEKVYNVTVLGKKKGFYLLKCEKLS